MDPFTVLTGIAAPLLRANIDTDLIIPKQFLKTLVRSGLGQHLFNPSQLEFWGGRYDFEVEVLAKGAWAGLPVKSVEVDVTYAEQGRRISHFKPLLDNVRISYMHALLLARRLVPWPHRRLVKGDDGATGAWWRHPVRFFRMLLLEHATPAELGMAAAVGTFLATLPLISPALIMLR